MKFQLLFMLVFITQLFFVDINTHAQAPGWLWVKSTVATIGGFPVGDKSIAIAADGSVYSIGTFGGTVDFDPGSGVYNITSVGLHANLFVSKLDASGNFIWAKSMGGISGSPWGNSIAIDSLENVYAFGSFGGIVDFNPGAGVYNLTGFASYVCKLDSLGNFVWARATQGGNNVIGASLALDNSGNVYTTGSFWGNVDFNPDSSGVFYLNSDSISNIFISKLNSSGDFVWAIAFRDTADDIGYSITVDNTNGYIYTTGEFSGMVDFDPGPDTFNITPVGVADLFISKFDFSGNFVWAKTIGRTTGKVWGNSIVVDEAGFIYTTGFYDGTTDFDPDTGTYNLDFSGTFILKLDSSGSFILAKAFNTGWCVGEAIAVDLFGNIYSTGKFGGGDFDPDTGTYILNNYGGQDIYISKLNSSGIFVWAKSMGSNNDDQGHSIVVSLSGNVYVTAMFGGLPLYFDTDSLNNFSMGTAGFVIAKLDTAFTTGMNKYEKNIGPSLLYPNPITNNFTIALLNNHKNIDISISDLTGKVVYVSCGLATREIEISTSGFSNGVYILQIRSDDFVETKKIIVSK